MYIQLIGSQSIKFIDGKYIRLSIRVTNESSLTSAQSNSQPYCYD